MTEDQGPPHGPAENRDTEKGDAPPAASTTASPKAREEVIVLTRPPEAGEGEAAGISPDALEAALERVVRRVFSRKIEKMLVEIMDRAVDREMERIRSLLLSEDAAREEKS